jgi:guanylate kinase
MAREQKRRAGDFHYVVANDDLDRAVAELEDVVRGEINAAARLSRT